MKGARLTGCSQSPPSELVKGILEFNKGLYYEFHETIEVLWVRTKGEHREFYQGIIQCAVALEHMKRLNYIGAVSLFDKGIEKLELFRPACHGLNVEKFLSQAILARSIVIALGEKHLQDFDWKHAPTIQSV